MKTIKMRSYIFFAIFILIVSCQKRRPPKGDYTVFFKYDSEFKPDKYFDVIVSESTKDYVLIKYPDISGYIDTLYKTKKQIQGKLGTSTSIFGEIKRNGLFSKFKIVGTFKSSEYTQSMGEFNYSGTFIIE